MFYIWTSTGGVSGTEPRASAAFLTLFIFLKILLLAKKRGEQYRPMLPTFLKQVFSRVCAFCVNVCVGKLWIKVLKHTGQATSSVCMYTVCVHMHACRALHRAWRGEMGVRGRLLFRFVCLFAALYARPAVPKASGGSVSSHLLAGAMGLLRLSAMPTYLCG